MRKTICDSLKHMRGFFSHEDSFCHQLQIMYFPTANCHKGYLYNVIFRNTGTVRNSPRLDGGGFTYVPRQARLY